METQQEGTIHILSPGVISPGPGQSPFSTFCSIGNMSPVFWQMLLSSFSIKSELPKATQLDPASLATDQITFIVSYLGVQPPTFLKAFVVDGSIVIVPLCPLSKLPHGKMILETCARKNFASPKELADFSLSDQEI